MGGIVNQSYVYGRLSYDLRDSSWCLDSLVHYYKKSDLPFPIFFIRKDANGKIIDRYPSEDPNIFLPAIFPYAPGVCRETPTGGTTRLSLVTAFDHPQNLATICLAIDLIVGMVHPFIDGGRSPPESTDPSATE